MGWVSPPTGRRNQRSDRPPTDLRIEIVTGVAASVSFLVFYSLLPLWISVFLAAAAYVGVKVAFPGRPIDSIVERVPDIAELLQGLQAITADFRDSVLRAKLTSICNQGMALLSTLQSRPQNGDASLSAVRQYLDLSLKGAQRFLGTAGGSARSAPQARATFEELLDGAAARMEAIHNALATEKDVELSAELKSLSQTVKDLDAVYLRVGEKQE